MVQSFNHLRLFLRVVPKRKFFLYDDALAYQATFVVVRFVFVVSLFLSNLIKLSLFTTNSLLRSLANSKESHITVSKWKRRKFNKFPFKRKKLYSIDFHFDGNQLVTASLAQAHRKFP